MPAATRSTADAWIAVGLGAVVLSFVAPLGLASGEAVDLAAAAVGARRPFADSFPLADLLTRLLVLLPAGELGVRPHFLALLAGAATVALRAFSAREDDHPLAGRLGAIALLASCRSFLEVATLRPTTAVDLAVLAVGLRLSGTIRVSGGAARAGLGLAFVAGLSSGASWSVRAVLWPLAVLLALRSLRRGHRWPVLAPTLFVAGLLPLVGAIIGASGPAPTFGQVMARIFFRPEHPPVTLAALSATARLIGEDLGVLALLVTGLGAWNLSRRGTGGWGLAATSWLASVGAAVVTGDSWLARVAAAVAVGTPLAAGVASLSGVFGQARHAAAAVVVVVAVVPAAWVGVDSALANPSRRAPAALARELDSAPPAASDGAAARAPQAVTPQAAARWRRYQIAVGGDRR